MRCLHCGNAVLTTAERAEWSCRALLTTSCTVCESEHVADGSEMFYVVGDSVLSYGQLMDDIVDRG